MIHTFTLNNMNFAVDGNSGRIHILDDLGYQILSEMQEFIPLENVIKNLSKRTKGYSSLNNGLNSEESFLLKYTYEDIKDAYNEIRVLKEHELLFSTAKSIEKVISSKKAADILKHYVYMYPMTAT